MQAIVEVVERLNAAWVGPNFDQLEDFFDPAVVLVSPRPGDGHRLVGRDAVIQSYRGTELPLAFLFSRTLYGPYPARTERDAGP